MASMIHEVAVIGANIVVENIAVPPTLSSVLGAFENARDCSDDIERDTGTQSEGSASSPDAALGQQLVPSSPRALHAGHGSYTAPSSSHTEDKFRVIAVTDSRKCQWKSKPISKANHDVVISVSTRPDLSMGLPLSGAVRAGAHHTSKYHTQPLFPGAYAAKLRTHRQAASDLSCLFKSIKDQ